jgi:hypothetical protein
MLNKLSTKPLPYLLRTHFKISKKCFFRQFSYGSVIFSKGRRRVRSELAQPEAIILKAMRIEARTFNSSLVV